MPVFCQLPCAVTNCEPAMVEIFTQTVAGALRKLEREAPIGVAELDAVRFDLGKLSPYLKPESLKPNISLSLRSFGLIL